MAREVQSFAPTIPAGTPLANPVVIPLSMPPRVVRRIEAQIPSGPRGVMGFQIGLSGRQLIPYNQGAYVIADGVSLAWDFDGLPTSGAWQLIGYNAGANPHTVYLRFLVDLPRAEGAGPAELLTPAQLTGLGGLTQAEAELAQLLLEQGG